MKLNLTKIITIFPKESRISLLARRCAIAFLISAIAFSSYFAIAFTPLNSALAATLNSNRADNAQQAAEEVVKDTGAKEIFGKSENGEELIDNAKTRASEKLNSLADKANSQTELPNSEKRFLDNLEGKS